MACNLKLKLDKKAIDKLYYYTHIHKFKIDNGIFKQLEISGKFILEKTNNYVLLKINEIEKGSEKESQNQIGFASFHTHPLELYKIHNVYLIYPSLNDYKSILESNCSFHVLGTREGIYIISLSEKIINLSSEQISKLNLDSHNIPYPKGNINNKNYILNINKYLNHINNLNYFNILFKTWNNADEYIDIIYKCENNSN
jgi:hypothetical protein